MHNKTLFALVLFVVLPTSALALDMEYYTYGGFNPVVQAFTRIALIFSDSGYQGLIFVMTVIGFVAGVAAWLARAATGARIIPLTWAVPVLFGAIVYLALFLPKGTITVYDPVLNRFQTLGDIPDAIVFTAGTLNKIERGLVDIIDTAVAAETAYGRTAGGIGFKALESVKGSAPKDNHARTSMIRYIRDCVTFELMRPGTTLSLDALRNTSTDFLVDLAQAVNPAVYTVYYDTANPSGTAMTCTQAWSHLQPIYAAPANYQEAVRKVCGKSFFDPDNAAELATCRDLLTTTLSFTTGMAVTPERIIRQRQIAEILYSFYFQDDHETAVLMESDRRITSSGLGIGLTMNEWIPIIRAIMTAIAIGIIPFLVLFLPTPIVGKAASVMLGFFVFLSTWGVTDAVIHGAAMDYAARNFEEVRQSSLGVYAMAALPSVSVKMLAMFGIIRSAGIMLASLFAMMLIRFGGHALAMLAGNLSRVVQGAGGHAGGLLTPEGLSGAMSQQARAAGLLDGMAEHRFANIAAAEAWSLHRKVGGHQAAMQARSGLQQSGMIPPGTSDGDMATMMAAANQNVGTSSGPVSIALGPDGSATRTRLDTVNTDGSTSMLVTGPAGTGLQQDQTPAGKASYAVDGSGNRMTTQASVHGLDPVKVATMAVQQKVVGAAKNLGSTTNWETMWQQLRSDTRTGAINQTYTDTLNNAVRNNWTRSFNDQSSFVQTMDQQTRAQLQTELSKGWRQILSAGGQISVVGLDGESVDFSVSEATAEAFARDQSRVQSEAWAQTFSTGQGLNYLANMAKRMGAVEAYSVLDEARNIHRHQESYGADLTTALIRNYAHERYGTETPETIRKTISDFNAFVTQQGVGGLNTMHDIVQGFVSGHGYGWGSTKSEVEETVGRTSARIHDQALLRGAVEATAGEARLRTGRISRESIQPSEGHEPLREPHGTEAIEKMDRLDKFNRREISGEGGIQTTLTGMAQQQVGKRLKGVVDDKRRTPATAPGYFNRLPEVSEDMKEDLQRQLDPNAAIDVRGNKR